MYDIAERFSVEARRYAAGLDYDYSRRMGPNRWPTPRFTDAGESICPLGACLKHMGLKAPGPEPYCPSADEVARALGAEDGRRSRIRQEAAEFSVTFDRGLITNLYEALGVER